jgi:RNA polymerase sigma-70 factor (ECF subfamily)
VTEDRLTELYRTYGPAIYWRCVRLLGDPSSAEDATQETFMRVHRHLDETPDADEALRWIFRVATNYCLNELRARRIRPEPVAEVPDRAGGGSGEQEHADRDLVLRVVDRLPEKLRAVAWLHHVDEMDQEEIARVLGISRRTVINRLAEFADKAQKIVRRAA